VPLLLVQGNDCLLGALKLARTHSPSLLNHLLPSRAQDLLVVCEPSGANYHVKDQIPSSQLLICHEPETSTVLGPRCSVLVLIRSHARSLL